MSHTRETQRRKHFHPTRRVSVFAPTLFTVSQRLRVDGRACRVAPHVGQPDNRLRQQLPYASSGGRDGDGLPRAMVVASLSTAHARDGCLHTSQRLVDTATFNCYQTISRSVCAFLRSYFPHSSSILQTIRGRARSDASTNARGRKFRPYR